MINYESFGDTLPRNWEEIADYLNGLIDPEADPDDANGVNAVWESYWGAYWANELPAEAPAPIMEGGDE